MEPAHLLGALVRGALGGRPHKRSRKALRYLTGSQGGLINAATLMTAAGVAWGLFETWQSSQQGQASSSGQLGGQAAVPDPKAPMRVMTGPAAGMSVPPPLPATPPAFEVPPPAPDMPPAVLRLVRLAVSAARADGALGGAEREAVLVQARAVGAEAFVLGELDRATPLSEIVAGVSDAREKETLYGLAFSIVRADEDVTGAERIYLAQLAALLGLDAASTSRLDQAIASRIDAQDDAN